MAVENDLADVNQRISSLPSLTPVCAYIVGTLPN